jgi:hypothetical protein
MQARPGLYKCSPIPAATVGYIFKPLADKLGGRLLLLLSNDPPAESSKADQRHPKIPNGVGIDVDCVKPGQHFAVDEGAVEYPVQSLRDPPPGL